MLPDRLRIGLSIAAFTAVGLSAVVYYFTESTAIRVPFLLGLSVFGLLYLDRMILHVREGRTDMSGWFSSQKLRRADYPKTFSFLVGAKSALSLGVFLVPLYVLLTS